MNTRKDFASAARAVREGTSIKRSEADLILITPITRDTLAHFLAGLFEEENPHFDRTLFLQECGINSHECPACGCQAPQDGGPCCSGM